jgi:AraC-like DNA-binding protein
MKYRQVRPSAATAGFIECYWILEDDCRGTGDVQRVVPDGRSELILNFGCPFESVREGRWEKQPACFFAGQITRPMLIRSAGPARMLGVRFRPAGARRVLRLPMDELAGRVVPLEEIAPGLERELRGIREYGLVDRILQRTACEERSVIGEAVASVITAGGMTAVGDVAGDCGLSVRQFERRFLDEVGMTAKVFCRIQRFQRVFQAMQVPGFTWADGAARCGYYDQAHLIRDFRDFSGEAPAALLRGDTDLARHFLQDDVVFFQD